LSCLLIGDLMKNNHKTKKQLIDELTELRSQNAELKKSENAEKYRSLVENIRDVIYELNSQGVVLYISPAIRDMIGFASDEIVGKSFVDLAHKDDVSSLEEWFSELRKGREYASEYRVCHKSGDLKWARTNTRPIMEDGLFKGARGILIDVTAQRRMVEALQSLTSRHDAILSAVPEIIMEVDNNKVYTWANSVGIEFFGEDVIGKEAAFYFEGEQETYDTVAPLFYGAEDIIYVESWQRRKDGEKRLLAWWCRVLKDESGQVTGALSSARDITKQRHVEGELQQSEKKYRELYDFLPIPIYEMDLEANLTSVNRAVYETFRGTEEDFKKGVNAWQILSLEDIDKSSKNIERLLKGEKVKGTEYTLMRLDGSVFPAIVISSVIYSNGKPVGLRGAIVDITERKHAEEALRKSEERFRNLFDNALEGVYQSTPKGRIISVNKAFSKMFGYESPEEVMTTVMNIGDQMYVNPDDRKRAVGIFKEMGHIESFECLMRRKDGRAFWASFNGRLSKTADGTTCFEGFVSDISERKFAEQTLQESEQRFLDVLQSSRDAILLIDGDKFIDCNEATARMLGYPTRNEFMKTHPSELSPPMQPDGRCSFEKAAEMMRTAFESGFNQFEWEHRKASGEDFPVEVSLTSIVLHGKNVLHCVWRDLTEQKIAEKQLRDTLQSLRKAFGTTIQVMVSAVESRDPYTAGHQLRSADLARTIATEMGLPQDKIEGIRMAGSIHDIGKLSVPAEILSKPTKLTEIEFSLIKEHPQKGYEMLKDVESPWPLAQIVYQHHERMDGSGYPRNLKGDEILMEARILAVSDVVESMASHRPYRAGLGIDSALEEISKKRSILYDTEVVDACLRLFKEKGYKFE
jgi:PAS domain S-box-containing protein